MTPVTPATSPEGRLRRENAELRARLEEAEDTLRAIRSGEVEALVVETADGPQVFTLQGRDAESSRFRGEILAQVSDAVIAMDLDQCVTYLNAAAERQYRVSAGDVLGRQLSHIFSQQWPSAEAEAAMWAASRANGEWRGEIIHHTHDGRELQVETWLTLLRDADGAEVGMVTAIRDITERKRRAAELQRVSVLLDTLLRTAPIGFCFLDRDLRFVRINERLAEINGIAAEAHLGRHVSEIVPTLADSLRDVTGRILATGEAELNHEFSGETPSAPGVMRIWNESWYPVHDGAGEVMGFGGVVEDITTRRQAEDALRERQRFTRRVLDNLFGFVGVLTADGTLTDANRAPLEAAGIPASEVLGKKFWDCYWWSYSPAVQAQLREACERAADGEVVRYDVPVRMAGDTRMWIDFQVAPLRDTEGRITHLIPSAMEIEVRRAAEEKLRESEGRFRALTTASSEVVYSMSPDWSEMRPLDGRSFLASSETVSRTWLRDYNHPEDLSKIMARVHESIRTKSIFELEHRVRRNDATWGWTFSRAVPILDAQGEITDWFGIASDVTARKTAELQLRQLAADLSEAAHRKDEFLATLAHELRNPLAPIRNSLQLLMMPGMQAAAVEQAHSMMDRQLTHMVRLIDDLMDVSRISRGKLQLRKEHVPLAAVLESALETIRPLVERMGQELTVTLPPQPLMVDADPTRLAQVFQNLLHNAAKYSDGGGQIHLNVKRQASDVVVTVKDTGIGIAADQLPRIFKMFTQIDGSLEKSRGGLGVGLTLVNHLLEMHGGRVEAMSEGLGRGSAFVVRLPIVVEASTLQESDVAPEHSVRSSFRILVVDDNRDGADSLSEMLKMVGNDTRTAYDGEAGVDAAGEFRPDVILLDIGMPKLNGYEVCRRIRDEPWGKGIVLIALTGWGQEEDRRRSREAGFDRHLVKPVDPQALMRLLAGLGVGHTADARRQINLADIAVPDSNR